MIVTDRSTLDMVLNVCRVIGLFTLEKVIHQNYHSTNLRMVIEDVSGLLNSHLYGFKIFRSREGSLDIVFSSWHAAVFSVFSALEISQS